MQIGSSTSVTLPITKLIGAADIGLGHNPKQRGPALMPAFVIGYGHRIGIGCRHWRARILNKGTSNSGNLRPEQIMLIGQ